MNCIKTLGVVIVVLVLQTASFGAEEEREIEKRSVSARVISSVGRGVGIRAERVSGIFTVPEGYTARNFKYKFHDPKSKVKLDKLTESSIYSVDEQRYITDVANDPDFELPPGKYKFHWTYAIKNGVVTGTGECKGPPHPSPYIQNEQSDYKFQGKIVNKRINGTATQQLTWEARNRDGGVTKHVYQGEGTVELQLRIDNTIVGSETHSGRTNGKPTIQGREIRWIGTWKKG